MKRSALLFHELRQQILSPALLAVGALFLLLQGCLFLLVLQFFHREAQFVRPICLWMKTFWMGTLLLVPPLTMRTVAEERLLGTLDTLLTASLGPAAIVCCKFFSCWLHVLLLWVLALLLPALAQRGLYLPFPFATGAELLQNIAFLALVQALHVAVGILWSTVAGQPIVAGTGTFLSLLCLLFAPRALAQATSLGEWTGLQHFLARQEVFTVLSEFQWGIFDGRTLLCYGGLTGLLLCCATFLLRRP
ncbi:MAG: hypothetical protein LBT98_03660 [Puniceicoccales bacterium]|jgi:ABC-2 type transport system permease protein|nr:hypothetical protein [Puniceicoccales bacterium]